MSAAKPTIRQTWRPDTGEKIEREVYLLLQHVSGELIHELAALLKSASITPEQYHVLRILRNAGAAGIALGDIAERSPSGDPDVTRLLDRLERQGLATRNRETADRRVILARITNEGKRLLAKLETSVETLHARQLGSLGSEGLREFRKLLRIVAVPPE